MPKLSLDDRNTCEGKRTLQECRNALQSMKNEDSLGNDGLTKEFYVCLFENLRSLLFKAIILLMSMGSFQHYKSKQLLP